MQPAESQADFKVSSESHRVTGLCPQRKSNGYSPAQFRVPRNRPGGNYLLRDPEQKAGSSSFASPARRNDKVWVGREVEGWD